jgi:hypothetical protein
MSGPRDESTAADRARAERIAQGLPPVVEDQVALQRVRHLLDLAAAAEKQHGSKGDDR